MCCISNTHPDSADSLCRSHITQYSCGYCKFEYLLIVRGTQQLSIKGGAGLFLGQWVIPIKKETSPTLNRDRGRAIASLTVPSGQEFQFPHFFLKFRSTFLSFPQTSVFFFLSLAFRVGESPTREGPGYATGRGRELSKIYDFLLKTPRSRTSSTSGFRKGSVSHNSASIH